MYCIIFGPLPSGALAAHLAGIDRKFWVAYNEAVYTRGASHRWEGYVTSQLARLVQRNLLLPQFAAGRGHEGTERISRTAVSPMPDFPGNMMVDFCINDTGDHAYDLRTGKTLPRDPNLDGPPKEEEQDSLSQVNGAWKINTIDTFTAKQGQPLAGETGMCRL